MMHSTHQNQQQTHRTSTTCTTNGADAAAAATTEQIMPLPPAVNTIMLQTDNEWMASFEDFRNSKHPVTGKYVMNETRLAWFREQELLHARRRSQPGTTNAMMSDERLALMKSLGFFANDTSVLAAAAPSASVVVSEPASPVTEREVKLHSSENQGSSVSSSGSCSSTGSLKQQPAIHASSMVSLGYLASQPLAAELRSSSSSNDALPNERLQSSSAKSRRSPQLPSVVDLSYWLLLPGRAKYCCLDYCCNAASNGCCARQDKCHYIHFQFPWGRDTVDDLWLKCSQRLPSYLTQKKYNERVLGLSAFCDDQWWYTARYSSDSLDPRDEDKKIILAEGGRSAYRSEQGICWYPTDKDAKDALERTVIITYWASRQDIHSSQALKGSAINIVATRIADAATESPISNGEEKRKRRRGKRRRAEADAAAATSDDEEEYSSLKNGGRPAMDLEKVDDKRPFEVLSGINLIADGIIASHHKRRPSSPT